MGKQMKSKNFLFLILVASLSLGFNWFGKKEVSSKEPSPKVSQQQVLKGQDSKNLPGTTTRAGAAQKAGVEAASSLDARVTAVEPPVKVPFRDVAGIEAAQQPVQVVAVQKPELVKVRVAKPPVLPAKRASIPDIQTQLTEIIRLNEQLQRQYREQVGDIQKVAEQARIHQKILSDIERNRAAKPGPTTADANAVLEQAKIRMIEEQTRKGAAFIEDLKKGSSASGKQPQ